MQTTLSLENRIPYLRIPLQPLQISSHIRRVLIPQIAVFL
jgi:hypothetical protein